MIEILIFFSQQIAVGNCSPQKFFFFLGGGGVLCSNARCIDHKKTNDIGREQ